MKRRSFIKGIITLSAYAICPISISIPVEEPSLQVILDELFNTHMNNVRLSKNNLLIMPAYEMEKAFYLEDLTDAKI